MIDRHRQREAYLIGRFLGYRVTQAFLTEYLEKVIIDPYIV